MRTRRAARRGLTLLEVLLATSLLVMTLSALAQLQDAATKAAMRAEVESEAYLLCQSEIDRLSAGVELPGNTDNQSSSAMLEPVAGAPGWLRAIERSQTSVPGLVKVTVKIWRDGPSRTGSSTRPAATLSRCIAVGSSQTLRDASTGVSQP